MALHLPAFIEVVDVHSEINPFHELYVTETARPDEYVRLFSPVLVEGALLLFQRGNVVLQGPQGCGKSMLLGLLQPRVRHAYREANEEFPLPPEVSGFIGAGINITRAGVMDFGQRPVRTDREHETEVFPLYFGDMVNYWIVRDILKSVLFIGNKPESFPGLVNHAQTDEFAARLAADDCWRGFLDGVSTAQDILERLEGRLLSYRRFHSYSLRELPNEIDETLTTIGEPVSRASKWLCETGAMGSDISLFIHIDQYEQLSHTDELRPNLGTAFRRVIHKALGTRDPRVSYRVGTRPYAWGDDLLVHGSTAPLERERDYRVISMDDLLRRKENRVDWLFPALARDIFARRLRNSNLGRAGDDALRAVVGSTPPPEERAREYAGRSDLGVALRLEPDWPDDWRGFIAAIYNSDPLRAMLAAAWARQTGGDRQSDRRAQSPPAGEMPPFDVGWWRKERCSQALVQVAANCRQRLNVPAPPPLPILAHGVWPSDVTAGCRCG